MTLSNARPPKELRLFSSEIIENEIARIRPLLKDDELGTQDITSNQRKELCSTIVSLIHWIPQFIFHWIRVCLIHLCTSIITL